MDLVQISNIFNALTQLNPELKFYHGGLHEYSWQTIPPCMVPV